MWDIAPQFNALVVFAEHRYYGKSLPYGNVQPSSVSSQILFFSNCRKSINELLNKL